MSAVSVRRWPIHRTKTSRHGGAYLLLSAVTVVLMVPIVWLFLSSLKADHEFSVWPIRVFPEVPQWRNYVDAVMYADFSKYAWNSAFLATTVAAISLLTNSMAGYAFARFPEVPGRTKLFALVIGTLLIPGMSLMIPRFILLTRLGMYNTYWPWILGAATGGAGGIFMFRQFFSAMPKELEEAAAVDGCGPFRVYWQIFLPNSLPVLATAFIFSFRGVWNDWLGPRIWLQLRRYTLAVAIDVIFKDPYGNGIPRLTTAAYILFSIPTIAMFFLAQRYIMQGVVTSGLKGV